MMTVTIAGRVSKGAQLTKAGHSDVANFRVQVGRGDDAQVVGCSLWGKRAVALRDHIVQGVPVTVSGALKLETHGGNTYLTIASVTEIELMDTVENVRANRERWKAKRNAERQQREFDLQQQHHWQGPKSTQGKRNRVAEGGDAGDVIDGGPWGLGD